MTKNFVYILGAALLVSCGEKTDTPDSKPAAPKDEAIVETPNRPVVVTDETSGSFTVDARSATGATFENKSDNQSTFSFSAQGLWSFAPAAGLLGPMGVDVAAGSGYVLPGAHSFALVVRRGDGTVAYVGDAADLTLKPREVIAFLMNDLKDGGADNRGSLLVKWTRK